MLAVILLCSCCLSPPKYSSTTAATYQLLQNHLQSLWSCFFLPDCYHPSGNWDWDKMLQRYYTAGQYIVSGYSIKEKFRVVAAQAVHSPQVCKIKMINIVVCNKQILKAKGHWDSLWMWNLISMIPHSVFEGLKLRIRLFYLFQFWWFQCHLKLSLKPGNL